MNRACRLPLILIVALSSCKKEEAGSDSLKNAEPAEEPVPAAAVSQAPAQNPHGQAPGGAGSGTGKVVETMDSGGYTYVHVETARGPMWAAAPVTAVSVGDEVSFSGGMPMQDFKSNTLEREFALIYFVPGLTVNGAKPPVPTAAGAPAASGEGALAVDVAGIAKADKNIAEIFGAKDALKDKEVSVRGKVVKYNGGIMGKNWLHIQDGSGDKAAGTNDLTVTTQSTANVGDTVLIKGTVGLDRDFGAGYSYGLILENATVTVE